MPTFNRKPKPFVVMNSKPDSKSWWCGQANKHLTVHAVALVLCMAATDITAQSYTVLHNFVGSDGTCPYAALVISGTTLYGTTDSGGSFGYGTVFKMNIDGSGFAVLHSFTGIDGSNPRSSVVLSGATLYGTTIDAGSDGGTVYKVNVDGSGFAVLKRFAVDNGAKDPIGGLVVSGTNIYGTTSYYARSNVFVSYGTVFKINTDGNDYAVLKIFSESDGCCPSGLLLSGATLYGATEVGGAPGSGGTLFKLNASSRVIVGRD
jgi:uncharacterized repeat protein (TIGR03803 family)